MSYFPAAVHWGLRTSSPMQEKGCHRLFSLKSASDGPVYTDRLGLWCFGAHAAALTVAPATVLQQLLSRLCALGKAFLPQPLQLCQQAF